MSGNPTGILFYEPRAKPLSITGSIQPGCYYQFYLTGTTTPTNVYADGALTSILSQTPGTGQTTAASDGRLIPIYMNPLVTYRVQLYSSVGVLLEDTDPFVPQPLQSITGSTVGQVLYPQTSAEQSAAVTPSNYMYPPGDLRRYGCDVTGVGDNTTQIQNAITCATATAGIGYIYHPGGTITHASQITVPPNIAVIGVSRTQSVFKFTGSPSGSPASTRSAWRYTGVAPWSGYANVMFRHVTLWYQNTVNFAAALELNAWGWAYWDIYDVWIKGGCSYGIILDGNEICSVHNCLIENVNSTANQSIWIVNGNDRGFTQGTGFSNVITLRDNQLSSNTNVSIGLLDDGGNAHVVEGNNFNGHASMANFAGVTELVLAGNSFENPQSMQQASANVRFLSASGAGNPVGPCIGVSVLSNGFFGNMSAAGSQLAFQGTLYNISGISKAASGVITLSSGASSNPIVVGQSLYIIGVSGMTQINGQSALVTAIGGSSGAWTATILINTSGFSNYTSGGQVQSMHTGLIKANNFTSVFGRGAAIDVTFLGNSEASCNFDSGTGTMSHYTGVHNDNVGNALAWPQNGSTPGNIGIANPTYGDARAQSLYSAGLAMTGALSPAQPAGTSQTGSVYQGSGVPSNSNGNNGDVYFRTDTPATANQRLYIKSAGTWTGIV